ncbi:M3 family metallopeptidase [Bacillus sp. PS06]|uniref:M3 family metallopeptidase n=1 Tax=Bacillus sp. PS06 TaxID=2764176 RepID=UPI00178204DE|nr:M3 family metallopeptidase [Bacillus sp. PS06]MBD8071266.1 oligoendopeptidase F [Bacillus sp. PS06]
MVQKKRAEVPVDETWNLEDIFSTEELWEHSYVEIEGVLDHFLKSSIKLENSKDVLTAVQDLESLLEKLELTTSYARYKFSEDGTDQTNQTRMGRTQFLMEKAANVKTTFMNAFLSLSSEELNTYREEERRLEEYNKFLNKLEEARKHTLSPELEDALASLDSTLKSAEGIYDSITSSDMKFEPVSNRNGKEVPVSLFMYMTQIETSPDTTLRRNAYKSLTSGLNNYKHGLAHTLATEIHKNISLAKLRGYPSTFDMLLQHSSPTNFFLDADGITSQHFEQILDTIRLELSPHMQRYAKLRQRELGLDKLLFSDVKAPLDPDFDPEISFEEAGEIIIEAVGVLGEEYKELMRKAIKERWVYRGDNVGRNMIAFGGGVHGVHGYVFYPWGGNLFDMILLGHELGHALHFHLAHENQRIINNSMPLFFIESPSTLIEHLIVQYLRETRDDPRLHRWLNMYLMMSYHHNFVTHVLEAELLRRLYKMAEAKQPLTTTTISETKGAILSEFWGDTVEIDEGAKLTWMRQPHYYMGLYPYTYSVGLSASTVIANRIKEEGITAGEHWTEVLKQGGAKKGLDLFNMAGLDLSNTQLFSEAIKYVGSIVDELEKSF